MKIVTIVGARPQFIKAGALSRVIKKYPSLHEVIIHTGQHFDENMSKIFFREMDIPIPDYNLNINGLSHGAMTGQMLEGIEKILIKEMPDLVIVFGDTNSTIAGALAAKKRHIEVAHVEAGLRSFNMKMPEEINRILTDRISDWLFCPTNAAMSNLKSEGFNNFPCRIVQSGDVMEDAALFYAEKALRSSILISLAVTPGNFILGTIHRAENTDELKNLVNIVKAFESINQFMPVVVPLHPRTKKILEQNNIKTSFAIIDPIGYFDMIMLLKNCSLVISDSGGLQKEAFFFRKYCITIREETEWIELVENGYNLIAGTNPEKIIESTKKLLNKSFPVIKNLFGNGTACETICKSII